MLDQWHILFESLWINTNENLADFLCCALSKRFTQSLNPQQKVEASKMAWKQCLAHRTIVRLYHYCALITKKLTPGFCFRPNMRHRHTPELWYSHRTRMLLCFPLLILKIHSAKSYGFELEQKIDWGSSLSTGCTLPLVSPLQSPSCIPCSNWLWFDQCFSSLRNWKDDCLEDSTQTSTSSNSPTSSQVSL